MMEIARLLPPSSPWEIYEAGDPFRFRSKDHMLLSEAVLLYVGLVFGQDGAEIAEAFTTGEPTGFDRNNRGEAPALISVLHDLLVTGRLRSFIRPFGGGAPRLLHTNEWEMDDPLARFAWSGMNPAAPYDPDATPTHWILVPRNEVDEILERAGGRAVFRDAAVPLDRPARQPLTAHGNGPEIVTTAPERPPLPVGDLLRRDKVLERTGMSKSTLYQKIEEKRFPAPVTLGTRMSRWREEDVADWLRDPK
ncbi:helix-turn-helix transcriptional regulator [uncultured Sphingomonas sp.]|uniref:helix-turn-helix transcriptional regulator n=1 Tax=uncultured Sphingomonas sp. TaxID=158754 RepID=UPI0035C9F2A7